MFEEADIRAYDVEREVRCLAGLVEQLPDLKVAPRSAARADSDWLRLHADEESHLTLKDILDKRATPTRAEAAGHRRPARGAASLTIRHAVIVSSGSQPTRWRGTGIRTLGPPSTGSPQHCLPHGLSGRPSSGSRTVLMAARIVADPVLDPDLATSHKRQRDLLC